MGKVLKILKSIITWTLVVISIGVMIFTVVSVTTFDKADRDIFGYKAFIVLSDSMSKTDFDAGDLILVKETDPATLQVGDIIAYTSTNTENYGDTVTHKIREITTDANGQPGFITYGTTTEENDANVVTYEYILGKYEKCIPNIGTFFQFLKTTPGYICCIFIPFMILIGIQAMNTVSLFRKYKKEQQEELEKEREAIAKERAESQKMMEELLKLRDQLGVANHGVNGGNAGTHITDSEGHRDMTDESNESRGGI